MASHSQHRHLKDLLKEEQEPFLLQNHPLLSPRNLQLNNKHNQNASFPSRFGQNACFSSSLPNADSPLFSPRKAPSRALFLRVPAKTAALLLEAALRIHNNSPKPKSSGLTLLGAVIRRFTNRWQPQKLRPRKTGDSNGDFINSSAENRIGLDTVLVEKSDLGEDPKRRLSSVWFEENKLSSSSASSSSSSPRIGSGSLSEDYGEDEVGFVRALEKQNGRNGDGDFSFSLSPFSPSRIALYKSTSPGRRCPTFSSPAMSPHRRDFQELQDEDEEKQQSSPVSILDSPFGDDDCEHGKPRDDDCGSNTKTECGYPFAQRSKQQLLQKLRKFESLAGLDKHEEPCKPNSDSDDCSSYPVIRRNIEGYLVDITRNSGVTHEILRLGMKRLLYDLISEEERSVECSFSGHNYEPVVKRVCKRLECWEMVEMNTIDMMIGMDLSGEGDEWNKLREDISWTAKMLEVSIFANLVDELLYDLVS